jgi:hypothetical protein
VTAGLAPRRVFLRHQRIVAYKRPRHVTLAAGAFFVHVQYFYVGSSPEHASVAIREPTVTKSPTAKHALATTSFQRRRIG